MRSSSVTITTAPLRHTLRRPALSLSSYLHAFNRIHPCGGSGSADALPCAFTLMALLGALTGKRMHGASGSRSGSGDGGGNSCGGASSSTRRRWLALVCGAVAHGAAIHLKIYPIIYFPAIMVFFRSPQTTNAKELDLAHEICRFVTLEAASWALVALGTLMGLTAVCYAHFGEPFLQESLVYHFGRTDHRHNYSIWWYALYLQYENPAQGTLGLAALLPQAVFLTVSSFILAKELPLCLLVQTMMFVHSNKVLTGQYFMWYIALMPLVWPHLQFKRRGLISVARGGFALWVGAILAWLGVAYLLEFKGQDVWTLLWMCSAAVFFASMALIGLIVAAYERAETCEGGRSGAQGHDRRPGTSLRSRPSAATMAAVAVESVDAPLPPPPPALGAPLGGGGCSSSTADRDSDFESGQMDSPLITGASGTRAETTRAGSVDIDDLLDEGIAFWDDSPHKIMRGLDEVGEYIVGEEGSTNTPLSLYPS